ncbi:unnamed protein product [Echinostoma caproni]|uniref:Neur_chan_memb domain-containing protein n=1 Tax=Echinostoma caproni TaxID=27848 RepID=A0A183A0Q3_9TREM|nr:unnamed protein product [Echinostoma caproni]
MISDPALSARYPPWQWTPETLKRFTSQVAERLKVSGEWSQRSTPEMLLDDPSGKKRRRSQKLGLGSGNDLGALDGCNGMGGYLLNSLKTKQTTIQIHTSLNDLRQALKNLMTKVTKKDALAKTAREWRLVVMTVDRIFFWFSLITIIASGFFFLYPRGQKHSVQEVLAMHEAQYERRNIEVAKQCLMRRQHM